MAQVDAALTAKWRRFDEGVDRVRSAQGAADDDEMHDVVNAVLHALYELWEYWRAKAPLRPGRDDDFVRSDPDGETAAALVHARGATTHRVFQEHGDFTDTYAKEFYDHYGCWRWEHFSDPDPRYAERDAWYKAHVAGHEVHEPLGAARRWLSKQPELSTP
jgi:hypothetical protein